MPYKYDLTISYCESLVYQIFGGGRWYQFPNTFTKTLYGRFNTFSKHYLGEFKKNEYNKYYNSILNIFQSKRIELLVDTRISKSIFKDNYSFIESELKKLADFPSSLETAKFLSFKSDHYYAKIFDAFISEEYEFTPEKDDYQFFTFLILMIADYSVLFIDEILDYHFKKSKDKKSFVKRLSRHLISTSEEIMDTNTLKVINEWISNIPKLKEEKISAPIIALFCRLLNDSKIEKRLDGEKIEDYCIKICKKYNLDYTDRVRQTFSDRPNKENIKNLKKMILSEVDEDINLLILEYLNTL